MCECVFLGLDTKMLYTFNVLVKYYNSRSVAALHISLVMVEFYKAGSFAQPHMADSTSK